MIKSTMSGRVGLTHASCECAVEICPQISVQNKRGLFSPHYEFVQDMDAEPDGYKAEQYMHIRHEYIRYGSDDDERHSDDDFLFHCFIGFKKGLLKPLCCVPEYFKYLSGFCLYVAETFCAVNSRQQLEGNKTKHSAGIFKAPIHKIGLQFLKLLQLSVGYFSVCHNLKIRIKKGTI